MQKPKTEEKPENEPEDAEPAIETDQTEPPKQEEEQKTESSSTIAQTSIYKEKVPEEIKTLPLETAGMEDKPRRCEIIDTKIIDPGIFKTKYTSYFVKTTPEGWVAERKFKAFVTLREILCKMYPGYIVPPLPCTVEKKLEVEDLEKRRHYLQLFLNDLLHHPILKTANIFHLFLSVASEKEYDLKTKAYLKGKAPKYVEDYHTYEGVARVSFSKSLSEYCNALATGNVKLKNLFREYSSRSL